MVKPADKKASPTPGPPAWQYKCHICGLKFEMPAPSGPAEEKSRTCPRCKRNNIVRIEARKGDACPPGG